MTTARRAQRQDLEFQLEQYALLTKLKRVSLPALKSWLATFRDELDRRRVSLNLFWTGSIIEGYSTEDVDRHRDNIIAILGKRFAGFDLDALGRDAREVQRAKCYMMIFLIEGISVNFFEGSSRLNLEDRHRSDRARFSISALTANWRSASADRREAGLAQLEFHLRGSPAPPALRPRPPIRLARWPPTCAGRGDEPDPFAA
jgi:hypothetical protein